jgi:Putative metal-binding motif/FG-GAP-like repeat/FG-GAP repeat
MLLRPSTPSRPSILAVLALTACGGSPPSGLSTASGCLSISDGLSTTARPTTWYPDADGDGFGDDSGAVSVEDRPCGYQAVGGDCDDSDAAIHPDASELCNSIDDDCDGTVDVGAPDATTTWPDADGDGYGDQELPTETCGTPPADDVTVGGDCDDTDGDVHPGVDEVCDNGLDDDCDGGSGACSWPDDLDPSRDALRFTATTSHDLFARMVALPGDLDGDGQGDLLLAAPGAMQEGNAEGELYLLGGPLTAGGQARAEARTTFQATDDYRSVDVVAAADFDGDGYLDLVMADTNSDLGANNAGAAFLYAGPLPAGTLDFENDDSRFYEVSEDAYLGQTMASGHDLDGDGRVDLLLGAPYSEGGPDYSSWAGVAWLINQPLDGEGAVEDLAVAWVYGDDIGSALAEGVLSPGDLDGDGMADVVVMGGAIATAESPEGGEGVVFVFRGPMAHGGHEAWDADLVVESDQQGMPFDHLFEAGDLDGDGHLDLGVTSSYAEVRGVDKGAAWTWTAWERDGVFDLSSATHTIAGPLDGSCMAAAAGGDLDGDGLGELALVGGALSGDDQPLQGWLLQSPIEGGVYGVEDMGGVGFALALHEDGSGTGCWDVPMVIGADATGDGRRDLLIGLTSGAVADEIYGAAWLFSAGGY